MTDEKYEKAKQRRSQHLEAILSSVARRKVVVAGPGTGKTYLFRKILEHKPNSLTLTFINALVDDLSSELYGLSEVRTLHSFARELIKKFRKGKEVRIFPRLSDLIQADLKILRGLEADFAKIFHNRDDENPHIEFYRQRKHYYDDTYGHSDVVFAAVRLLEQYPDRIPEYDQIVVDEFQDFNLLEASLIDCLAERSPILLAGDDDQALYDFKHASAVHIRKRHADDSDYERFNLPLCSRCPRVIVDAANDVISGAMSRGLLAGRIRKPYEYFDDKAKDRISELFPKLVYSQLFASQFAWFIEKKLDETAVLLHEHFSVLVIAPAKVHARSIAEALRTRGFKSVHIADRSEREISLLDGYKLLLTDKNSNLGWRIVAGLSVEKHELKKILDKTEPEHSKPLRELVSSDLRKTVKDTLSVLRKVRDGEGLKTEDLALLAQAGLEPLAIGLKVISGDLGPQGHASLKPGLRAIPIKITTVQGSKGLAADVVFLTYLDDRFFVDKEGITDKNVCNFLVGLTRGKKRVILMSSKSEMPTFVSWIANDHFVVEEARPSRHRS